MGEIFRGSEAVAAGDLTEYQLQRRYRTVFRGIYMDKRARPTLRDRTVGAWLFSKKQGTIAGTAASALHGADWIDADVPIELISPTTGPQLGLVVRSEELAEDEVTCVAGLPVTTPARTAFDLGRHLPRLQALARLDALMRAAPFTVEDVQLLMKRRKGARGSRQLRELLPLVDGGAMSPQETRLRLLFIDAGFPKPTTQIRVVDEWGRLVRTLDMGWEDFMVAAEYDGDQHQIIRAQYVKDRRVLPKLKRMGWNVISVIKEDRDAEVLRRTHDAMVSRGWKP
jgi:hypothetical protein